MVNGHLWKVESSASGLGEGWQITGTISFSKINFVARTLVWVGEEWASPPKCEIYAERVALFAV